MRHLSLILVLSTLSICGAAQSVLFSPNQQLVEEAIKGGILVIEQSYQLEDTTTHQRYGRYGKPEFGKNYSFAVRAEDGVCLTDPSVHPWNYDENFARYSNSHKPVLYKSRYRELNDSLMTDVSLNYATALKNNGNRLFFIQDTSSFKTRGLSFGACANDRFCWIVWITSSNKEDLSSARFNLVILKKKINILSDSTAISIEPIRSDKKILGGVVLSSEQAGIGQIVFKLCGVITSDRGEWVMIVPSFSNSVSENPKPADEELTPADKSGNNEPHSSNKKSRKNINNKKK